MGRGEYGHNVGQLTEPALSPDMKERVQRSYERGQQAFEDSLEHVTSFSTPDDPWAAAAVPMQPQRRPWTEAQKKDFQRALGISTIGSVAGAVLWKEHRIWGFILGGMAGGGLANIIFAPTSFDGQ